MTSHVMSQNIATQVDYEDGVWRARRGKTSAQKPLSFCLRWWGRTTRRMKREKELREQRAGRDDDERCNEGSLIRETLFGFRRERERKKKVESFSQVRWRAASDQEQEDWTWYNCHVFRINQFVHRRDEGEKEKGESREPVSSGGLLFSSRTTCSLSYYFSHKKNGLVLLFSSHSH